MDLLASQPQDILAILVEAASIRVLFVSALGAFEGCCAIFFEELNFLRAREVSIFALVDLDDVPLDL